MTQEQAVEELKELAKIRDFEEAHSLADKVLCDLLKSLGHADVADAWGEVGKWYA